MPSAGRESSPDAPDLRPRRWPLIVAAVSLAVAAAVVLNPIERTRIAGIAITAKDPTRPILLALAASAWYASGRRDLLARLERALRRGHLAIALTLAALTLALGLTFGSRVVWGADTYAYVSEADLWLAGHLRIPMDFVARAPWPDAITAFSPLGYRPAVDGRAIVPVHAPGLPLMMAVVKRVLGHCGVFLIVPLCCALFVVATYGIGRAIGMPIVGLTAAWLVATSPTTMFIEMLPMSDLPSAAGWAIAVWALLGDSRRRACAAGLAAASGVVIRPNLAPLLIVFALWTAWRDVSNGRWRRPLASQTLALLGPATAGVAIVGAINARLYGAPWISGYGSLGFSLTHVPGNLRSHASWLSAAETPLAFVGLASLFLRFRALWTTHVARRAQGLFVAVAIVVWAPFLFMVETEPWWNLRYFLPLWPMMMLGTSATAAALYRIPSRLSRAAGTTVVVALGVWGVREACGRGALEIWRSDQTAAAIARTAEQLTPPGSLILSVQHSGSLRYYAGRWTARWDMPAGSLDRAVTWSASEGHHPYWLLEDWEERQLRDRSTASDAVVRALRTPLVEWRYGPHRTIRLYDALDPSRPNATPRMIDLTTVGDMGCVMPAYVSDVDRGW